MENYRTEEEQVEALRKWWQENGRSTVFAVALALGAGFGWQGWQQYQLNQSIEASARYDEMLDAVSVVNPEGTAKELKYLAEGIKADYPSSTYAQFAALHLARVAVQEDDLDQAEAELRWVLTQSPKPELSLLTELRLARVLLAQGDADAALKIVQAAAPGAYEAAFAEVEGDIRIAQGDTDSAIAAYERALALSAASGAGASEGLQLKLGALTPVPARELATLEE